MFGVEDVAEIERAIQAAIAPAFLLTGIFSLLNVLTGPPRPVDRPRTGHPQRPLAAACGAS